MSFLWSEFSVTIISLFPCLIQSNTFYNSFYCQLKSCLFTLFKIRRVRGLHLNMIIARTDSLGQLLSLVIGRYLPFLVGFTKEDVRRLYPYMEKNIYDIMRETGYLHIQATKPDTVGNAWDILYCTYVKWTLNWALFLKIFRAFHHSCRMWTEWLSSRIGCVYLGEILLLDRLGKQRLGGWRFGKVKRFITYRYNYSTHNYSKMSVLWSVIIRVVLNELKSYMSCEEMRCVWESRLVRQWQVLKSQQP